MAAVGSAGGGAATPPPPPNGGSGAAGVDTTPPVISLGNASCTGGTGAAANVPAVTPGGLEVVLTAVPVGEPWCQLAASIALTLGA